MSLVLEIASESDLPLIEDLYEEAFPPEERIPFVFLCERAMAGTADMFKFIDEGELVGFAYAISAEDMVYLFFFAMSAESRGKGYGTAALEQILRHYEGKRLFLVIEPLDSAAENFNQRVKRHNFYLRCGLKDLPFTIREDDITYEAMGTSDITEDEYYSLIAHWLKGTKISPFESVYARR